ncbi:histidine kinase [Subtercola lobariae]|uniref:histidine kinase n=1 Tax=Subtercola lobariae TaxID=1588641 RepID=A0A917B2M9_9MICO|nr:histidine kinase [Subtercola lobariae]GGF15779.1 two-component sensor histidine kinase [Subtercola lobariae]
MFAWFEGRPGVTDVLLGAVALVLFGAADYVRGGASAALITIIFAAAIVFWRRMPGLGLAIAWVGALVQIATVDGLLVGDILILGVVFATGLSESKTVRWAGIFSSIVGGGVAGARLTLYAPTYGDGEYIPTDPFYRGVSFVIVSGVVAAALALFWTLGVVVRNRRATVAARSERERERIVAEATLTQERERALLSREMHDLVGHALAVVIAQSDGARYAKLTDPNAEATALATINRTARAALDDVHELLQVLREPAGSGRETPGAADLELLLASVREAGLNVTLTESGDRMAMSAAHELALYRVLQESLTNAIKHGGRETDVQVTLDWHRDAVHFRVLTTERLATGSGRALGQGIIGMKERMRLLGGAVQTGARTFGVPGFSVEGHLPFNATEAEAQGAKL